MEPEAPASAAEAPPPEALVIRTAREAAGMTMAQAAAASDGAVSATYWRDVERGFGGRRGKRVRVRASTRTLAAMARITGATPGQLTTAQREDAARVLAEIQRRDDAPGLTEVAPASRAPATGPGDDAASALFPDDPAAAAIWRLAKPAEYRESLIAEMRGDESLEILWTMPESPEDLDALAADLRDLRNRLRNPGSSEARDAG